MIDVYHLAGAAPIAMIGMFALWAAASNRHWFVRTVIAATVVLATLLIPAYELAYQLGIESLLVVAGMAIWRERRIGRSAVTSSQAPSHRFGLSLETLMLAVVIVAVATAVIARTPDIEPYQWYDLVVSGVTSAAVCLVCVWLMCGRAHRSIRLLAAPLLIVAMAVAMHFLKSAAYLVRVWGVASTPLADFWQGALRDASIGIYYWIVSISLGMAMLCTWILLMRAAGWFDPFPVTSGQDMTGAQRGRVLARWATVLLFCIASLFPVALFYRLLTPTPIPEVILPVPNGFDDFVAAGRMAVRSTAVKLVDQLTDDELGGELAKLSGALDKMHDGLKKETLHPYVFKPWAQDDAQALVDLLYAVDLQAAYARRNKDVELELANRVNLLRLAHAESRGMATDNYSSVLGHGEWCAHADIWKLRGELPAAQIKPLIVELREIDHRREPWSMRAERQRTIEANAGWQRHAAWILEEWSGKEHDPWERIEHLRRVTELRVLIVELALRAFQFEHGRLPARLSELVPDYLPAVPQDPFSDGEIKYRREGDSYELYSIGPDGVDDRGKRAVIQSGAEIGDFTPAALFGPPITANQPSAQNSAAESEP